MTYIDLTHPFTENMPVFPGDPPARLQQTATVAQDEYAYFHLKSGLHVGTHMECAAHVFEHKPWLADIPPQQFFGRGRVIDARGKAIIEADLLPSDVAAGDAVVVCTGMSAKFGEASYCTDYPPVSAAFADEIARRGVKIIGLDALSPEPPPVDSLDIHRRLLHEGALLIENLTNLESLLGLEAFDIVALPVRFTADSAFTRVIAIVQKG